MSFDQVVQFAATKLSRPAWPAGPDGHGWQQSGASIPATSRRELGLWQVVAADADDGLVRLLRLLMGEARDSRCRWCPCTRRGWCCRPAAPSFCWRPAPARFRPATIPKARCVGFPIRRCCPCHKRNAVERRKAARHDCGLTGGAVGVDGHLHHHRVAVGDAIDALAIGCDRKVSRASTSRRTLRGPRPERAADCSTDAFNQIPVF